MSNDIEWKMVNLAKNCTIKARIGWQGVRSDEYRKNGDFLLITGTDFENGFINYDTCSYVDEWRYLQDANIQLKNDDVLITKDGTIGKIAFVKNLEMPATLNSGIFVIRPKEDIGIYPEYLSLVFKSSIFTDFLDRITAGSTIVHLYQKDIVKFEFPIPYKNGTPDLETQKQIAQKLGDMDRLIAAKEKLLAKKRNLKVAAMQKLIKDEEGENWKKVKLGECGIFSKGSGISRSECTSGVIPAVRYCS
jgi:type I restriction enzyme S subunit